MNMKRPASGLPYLRTALKFNWDSTADVDTDALHSLLEDVATTIKQSGSGGGEDKQVVTGVQACLDWLSAGEQAVVIIAAESIRPSAVAAAIGLLAINASSTTPVYSVPELRERTGHEAVGLRMGGGEGEGEAAVSLPSRVRELLHAVRVADKPKTPRLAPVTLFKSIGKDKNKKKNKKK